MESRLLSNREIPRRQIGTDQRVPTQIAVEAAVFRWCQKCVGIEPLDRVARDDRPCEIRIQKWPHLVASVAVVRWVVADVSHFYSSRNSVFHKFIKCISQSITSSTLIQLYTLWDSRHMTETRICWLTE